MINTIEEALNAVRTAATDHNNRVINELSASYDADNAAKTMFNEQMKLARQKRAEADEIQEAAMREYNTARANAGAVALSIVQQLSEGQMITGSNTPAPKRLRVWSAEP